MKKQKHPLSPFIFSMILTLGLSSILWPQKAFSSIYGYYAQSRLYLGAGHNPYYPLTGYIKCIDHEGMTQENTHGAVESEVHLRMVKSRDEMYRLLNVSASMSGGISFFKGGYSLNLVDESAFQEDSLTWMILFKSDYGNFTLKNPKLNSQYSSLNPQELYNTCGSEVVTEERRGAMVYAIFTLKNLSASKKYELEHKLNLSARGSFWNAQMEANYQSILRSMHTMSDMSLTVKTLGGRGMSDLGDVIGQDFTDFSKIPQTMSSYIKNIRSENASPLYFITTHISSFTPQLPVSYNHFRDDQASLLYERVEDLAPQAKRMHEILYGPLADIYGLSQSSRQQLQNSLTLFQNEINKLVSIGKKCFNPETDNECLLPETHQNLPLINWSQLTLSYRCESIRREAYQAGFYPLEYYHMAKKRSIYPLVENNQVIGYESCSNLI